MDTYEPTKKCLEVIKPYLTKGSIVAFDELNCDISKGITPALKETFDISRLEIKDFLIFLEFLILNINYFLLNLFFSIKDLIPLLRSINL